MLNINEITAMVEKATSIKVVRTEIIRNKIMFYDTEEVVIAIANRSTGRLELCV